MEVKKRTTLLKTPLLLKKTNINTNSNNTNSSNNGISNSMVEESSQQEDVLEEYYRDSSIPSLVLLQENIKDREIMDSTESVESVTEGRLMVPINAELLSEDSEILADDVRNVPKKKWESCQAIDSSVGDKPLSSLELQKLTKQTIATATGISFPASSQPKTKKAKAKQGNSAGKPKTKGVSDDNTGTSQKRKRPLMRNLSDESEVCRFLNVVLSSSIGY